MSVPAGLKVLFVAGFGPVAKDPAKSKKLYLDTLGLPLEAMPGDPNYFHGDKLDGVKHFGLWPLSAVAQSYFGKTTWPADVPEPQAWLELDVEDVASATEALKKSGYKVLVETQKEPWGQTVTRLLSPEGLALGLTFTPQMR